MCIAIFQPEGKILSEEKIRECARNNGDGFGFLCTTQNEKLFQYKTMNLDMFIKAYNDATARYGKNSPFLVHFRLGTGGTKNIENCHPFMCSDEIGFVHNGVIVNKYIKSTAEKSDTNIFNEAIMSRVAPFIFPGEKVSEKTATATQELIHEFLNGDRMIVMNNRGEAWIFNEQKGHYDKDGFWYSNAAVTYNSKPTITAIGSERYTSIENKYCCGCKKFFKAEETYTITNPKWVSKQFCINCAKQRKLDELF